MDRSDFCCPGLRRGGLMLVFAVFAFCFPSSVRADETDNFYLPLSPEFVDLGYFLEGMQTQAIEESVKQVNIRIERALSLKNPEARVRQLAQCHEGDMLAEEVSRQFGDALTETLRADKALSGSWARQNYPERTVAHRDISMNLHGHFILDPRALLMFSQGSTIKAFGVYFGTDKLTHFHQLGYKYYTRYRTLLREGQQPDEALKNVAKYFAESGFWAEGNGFGTASTGVYSNGDMAANYAGFKFFLNLTDKIMLLGKEQQPLVVRCGVFWRVNDHVRPQSGWLRAFITDHWNEALNPSLYDSSMRPRIQRILQNRASRIVEFYTKVDERPRDPTYFENLARTLSTYDGEPYGHSGQFDKLMTIGNTCIPALSASEKKPREKSSVGR